MMFHPIFSRAPDKGQFAVDGEWEKALAFSPGRFSNTEEVSAYINRRNEVAFEAFFGNAFFGYRIEGPSDDLARIIASSCIALQEATSGVDFFNRIKAATKLPLGEKFFAAEIGAVNAWKSVGPLRVDDPRLETTPFEELWRRVTNSSIYRNDTHLKAIEFAFENGDGNLHWFALPLSGVEHPYVVDPGWLKASLQAFRRSPQGRLP